MRIKKIEIEGFKSYSHREIVANLDSEFNAITGLNGSGKSNILDAICFLLGLTNLTQVRAHTLNDLVYKHGQAGITRATVTIAFDNDVPPAQQPVGYSKYKEIIVRRQIIINGKNTYQINGTSATNQRVSDLFRMVGINVNNPHFLIMQGRITKVLNMKPMEILSMIEEAAGVRMYECKKQSALRTIEKKENRVHEISRLCDEDINPRVERLKKERASYLEYQQLERDLERKQRKLVAYDYQNSKLQVKEMEKRASLLEEEANTIGMQIDELETEIKTEQESLKEMESAKAQNIGPELNRLEKGLKDKQNEQVKIESERDAKESNLSEIQTTITRKRKSIENDTKDLAKKRKQLEQVDAEIGGEEQRGKAAEDAVTKARQKLEALAKGMTTDEEGNAVTLEAHLTSTRTQLSEHQTNVKKAQMQLEQLNQMLKEKRTELQKSERRSGTQQDNRRELEAQIAQIEANIHSMNFDTEAEGRLERERRQLIEERALLAHEVERFEAKHYNLQFKYRDPYPGFDRRKVKGVVAKLFRMRDMRFATALEVVAGGRLYNVVIDEAKTGTALLKSGLEKRVTMLPLDKTTSRMLNRQQIEQAKRIVGPENVFFPADLVDFDPEIQCIIQSIFGNCLICANMEQAQRLAFDRSVNCRTVTLSGEDFRPSGLLTGGFRKNDSSLLQALNNMYGRFDRVNAINRQINEIEAELARMKPIRQQCEQLRNQLNIQQKQLDNINEAMKSSPTEVLRRDIAELETEAEEANIQLEKSNPEIETLSRQIKELEDRKKNEKAFAEKEKKQAQKALMDAQKELEQLKGTFSKTKESLASLREEITSLEQSIEEEGQEIEQLHAKMAALGEEIVTTNERVTQVKEKVKEAQSELDKYNKELRQQDKQIRIKTAEIEEQKKRIRQAEQKKAQKEQDAADAAKSSRNFEKRVQQLEKANVWIPDEKGQFDGAEGTLYCFHNYSYEIGKREVDKMKERSKELLETVNPKAMHLLGTAEEQLTELSNKRQQLEKDKKQLYDAIDQLDEKKRKELLAAHKQISTDFGAIYSTLLPGASAELIPPSGSENCLSGLEVKVAFNGKYKESLTELSGGQRSLVALSLILAMLKFKPAPFYILDEIDAALDISHTENIGKMIKNHFSQSQFIVVSLKQGFFDNAKVVYRVNFHDGRSVVTRTENRH